jgi:type IV secretory pathway VirB2 component (pilin)
VQRVGTTLIASVAGVAAMNTVTPADDSSAVGFPALIGANTESTQALTGDIAEIVAIGGTITTSNQAGLVAYFNAKYGL